MNIIRRLLNVLAVVPLFLFSCGVATPFVDFQKRTMEHTHFCEELEDFERTKGETRSGGGRRFRLVPLDFLNMADARQRCASAEPWLVTSGDSFWLSVLSVGGALILAFILALLNYVLFGTFTLWNKRTAERSSQRT